MKTKLLALLSFTLLMALGATALLVAAPALAADGAGRSGAELDASVWRWAYLSAAATTCVSSLAAAYAVGRVGSAAVGALTEKPELFGRVVVLVGLAEGIAIYGLIVSILILNQVG